MGLVCEQTRMCKIYSTVGYVRRKVDMSVFLDFLCFRGGGSLTSGSIALVLFLLPHVYKSKIKKKHLLITEQYRNT